LLSVFRCTPVRKAWDASIEGRCVDQVSIWMAGSICNIVTDCLVTCVPMPYLWGLQMGIRGKIALACSLA
ncbi:hypothetical protein B0T10DRAFT_376757, partial [Thelonectria olida]